MVVPTIAELPLLEGFHYSYVSDIIEVLTLKEMQDWDMMSWGSSSNESYDRRTADISADYSLRNPF